MLISTPAAVVAGGPARSIGMYLRAAARAGAFDGMPPGPRGELLAAVADLEAAGAAWLGVAAVNARTQAVESRSAGGSAADELTIGEVAAMLDVTPARVRQIAAGLGSKRGGRWVLDRPAVLAEFERRGRGAA